MTIADDGVVYILVKINQIIKISRKEREPVIGMKIESEYNES